MEIPQLFVRRADPSRNFYLPEKRSEDAGYDLKAALTQQCGILIEPGERSLIPTNLVLSIPKGFYGRIAPRSGLAFKFGIDILAGVIDSGYRAEVGIIILNTDKRSLFQVKEGDRIAQLIIEPYLTCDMLEVHELSGSERGQGGFGSTGTR